MCEAVYFVAQASVEESVPIHFHKFMHVGRVVQKAPDTGWKVLDPLEHQNAFQ